MARFLLVHGSCHGAWSYDDLVPALAALGHEATAIDLPGHGQDRTPLQEVTLAVYADAILNALTAMEGPAIVVGHSMGGFPITAAAQSDPSRIAALVYLCAYLPQPGRSLAEMRRAWPERPLDGALVVDQATDSMAFADDRLEDLLYQDCPPGTVARARARLTPQPLSPQRTALPETGRAEALPRHYIVCTRDATIPPDYQRAMAARLPERCRHSLDTGHSPFFAAPAATAELLDTIAGTVNPS